MSGKKTKIEIRSASEEEAKEIEEEKIPETKDPEETEDLKEEAMQEEAGPEEKKEPEEETPDGDPEPKPSRKEKKELEKKQEEIDTLTDRLQRVSAEYENYRKRTEKEKSTMYGLGVKAVVEEILPVMDNFERGIAQIPEDQKEDPLATGMEAIHKQFLTTLEKIGVKPIEALGQAFDPELHNAVMHVEDENEGENVIVEEFQKGYQYQDLVIRHSMVKVAN